VDGFFFGRHSICMKSFIISTLFFSLNSTGCSYYVMFLVKACGLFSCTVSMVVVEDSSMMLIKIFFNTSLLDVER
jgi:hypothetical protein